MNLMEVSVRIKNVKQIEIDFIAKGTEKLINEIKKQAQEISEKYKEKVY